MLQEKSITQRGFTLLETLIALSLLLLSCYFGMLSFTDLRYRNEEKILVDEIIHAIQFARGYALASGIPAELIPDEPTNWNHGISLKVNDNTTSRTLEHWQFKNQTCAISWHGTQKAKIIFASHASESMSNGYFLIKNHRTHQETKLILNRLGRLRVINS